MMSQNTDFELERARLHSAYQKLNAGKQTEKEESPATSYWTFLKLRIGFSVLLFFFFAAGAKAFDSPKTINVQKVLQQIDQKDPYTQKAIEKVQSVFPK